MWRAAPPGAAAPLSSYCQKVQPSDHALGMQYGAGCVYDATHSGASKLTAGSPTYVFQKGQPV